MKHYLKTKSRLYIDFGTEGEGVTAAYRLKCIVRAAIAATLTHEGFDRAAEVSVTFCDDDVIRTLNRDFRDRDAVTDVLSFPQYEAGEAIRETEEPVMLGDVVLCLSRARTQAAEVGNTFYREVAFLCIHSILHLLGYDHEKSAEEAEEMYARQREIVKLLPVQMNDKGCNQ